MSILGRIGLVIRSYLKSTSDRIDSIAAEQELRQTSERKKLLDEIHAGAPPAPPTPTASPHVARLAADYKLLGLPAGADLPAVEGAWRRLSQRADPKRFPAGSEEEKRAGEILAKLNEAYARLREELNPTEGRFGQLEL